MKVVIEYKGQPIEVDEDVKNCLEELDRKAESLARKNRRHELLWDSVLLEGMDGAREVAVLEDCMEDKVLDSMEQEKVRKAIAELGETDRGLIVDRYFNQMKFRELSEKYGMPSSSVQTKIDKALKMLKHKIM